MTKTVFFFIVLDPHLQKVLNVFTEIVHHGCHVNTQAATVPFQTRIYSDVAGKHCEKEEEEDVQ